LQQVSGPAGTVDAASHDTGSGYCVQPRCGVYVAARIPSVPNGSTATFRLIAAIKTSFENALISNTATVQSTSVDPVGNNNQKELWVFAGPNADLVLTRHVPDVRGLQVPITINIRNEGPETVNNVTITNDLRETDGQWEFVENVKYLQVMPSRGTCAAAVVIQWPGSPNPPAFWRLDCALGALVPGATATVTLTIERTLHSGTFSFASWLGPAENDPNVANNEHETLFTPYNARKRAVRK
jgi:hypothetical protein